MSVYERELKGILAGDPKVLAAVSKSLSQEERSDYHSTAERPFLVVRAAGSLGVDLVAVRGAVSLIIEAKAAQGRALRFSRSARLVAQMVELRRDCQRAGVLPIYAYRLKGHRGDAWRVFTLPALEYEGRTRLLYARIPPMEATKSGNPVLRWDNGIPLSRLINYLNSV